MGEKIMFKFKGAWLLLKCRLTKRKREAAVAELIKEFNSNN